MKTQVLNKEGLSTYDQEIKDYIKSQGMGVTLEEVKALIDSSDKNTTYTLTKNENNEITLTGSDGSTTSVTDADTNTTYGVATSSTLGLVKSGTDITVDSSGNVSVNDDSHNHVISNVGGLQSVLDGKSATGHTHDDRYYTESEIDSKLSGKANSSHGNHVPATQTANNATFFRNDNTWQKVTPANIGAATSSHTHSAYVNQNAFSNIVVGSTTVSADSTTDSLTLVGSNVTITPDATNDKVTIGISKTNITTALGYTPYTPSEVDTKINNILSSVATDDDIDAMFK